MPRPRSDYIFFHKIDQPYGWASQWYPSPFKDTYKGSTQYFPTAEHYMMYRKAILFDDLGTAEQILHVSHPAEAKKLGRIVRNFNADKWNAECSGIVRKASYLKFSQNDLLKAQLLSTEDKFLAEASSSDRIWGIGFNAANALANKDSWGQNLLGKALMHVREELRRERDGS